MSSERLACPGEIRYGLPQNPREAAVVIEGTIAPGETRALEFKAAHAFVAEMVADFTPANADAPLVLIDLEFNRNGLPGLREPLTRKPLNIHPWSALKCLVLSAFVKNRTVRVGEAITLTLRNDGPEPAAIRCVITGLSPVIHALAAGMARCGTMGIVVPAQWPEGHMWSNNVPDITCDGCKAVVADAEKALAERKALSAELVNGIEEFISKIETNGIKLPGKIARDRASNIVLWLCAEYDIRRRHDDNAK